jgi:hypothetical protein
MLILSKSLSHFCYLKFFFQFFLSFNFKSNFHTLSSSLLNPKTNQIEQEPLSHQLFIILSSQEIVFWSTQIANKKRERVTETSIMRLQCLGLSFFAWCHCFFDCQMTRLNWIKSDDYLKFKWTEKTNKN